MILCFFTIYQSYLVITKSLKMSEKMIGWFLSLLLQRHQEAGVLQGEAKEGEGVLGPAEVVKNTQATSKTLTTGAGKYYEG